MSLELLRQAWTGASKQAPVGYPSWPSSGFAIEGDFSGIQKFVLRPVPGAGGAARRLRARSFRVLALTRLVAQEVERAFAASRARLFYSAGGRFLVVCDPTADGPDRLAALQRSLDASLLTDFQGELAFHLASAPFSDGSIPREQLSEAMRAGKWNPLAGGLQDARAWASGRFVTLSPGSAKCDGCGGTALVRKLADSDLCPTCISDRDLGARLLGQPRHLLAESPQGSIALLGKRWDVAANGTLPVPSIAHAPAEAGQLATFEQLAARSKGRPYLAYLRIDADKVGEAFAKLQNDPVRVWALSRLLDSTFTISVDSLLRTDFRDLYPVYGGGDDLFLIGPWNQTLHFAARLWRDFQKHTGGQLTFSAGVALAKKRQHILTKSEEAEEALNRKAKLSRAAIHALGATIPFTEYEAALQTAERLEAFHASGGIRSAMLQNIVELHARSQAGDTRWHSLLFYQAERNLNGEALDFIRNAFLNPANTWKHAGFAARYAMLAGRGQEHED